MKSSLPEDLMEEYQAISDWVIELFRQHCDQITIKVVDAASIEGFIKSLRHRVRRYPAVIVDGKRRFLGGSLLEAENEITRLLRKDALFAGELSNRQEGGSIEEDQGHLLHAES